MNDAKIAGIALRNKINCMPTVITLVVRLSFRFHVSDSNAALFGCKLSEMGVLKQKKVQREG